MTSFNEATAVYEWAPAIPDDVGGQLLIALPEGFEVTEDWWEETREANRHVRIELTPNRKLRCCMVSWSGSRFTLRLGRQILDWMDAGGGGEGFDSAAGYDLPAGFRKFPDGSWVSDERIPPDAVPPYPDVYEVVPDLIWEIRSPRQSLDQQQGKMVEWIDGGVRLGWLIDPFARKVWIYRANGEVEELEDPAELSGEDVCSGLVIDMSQVWE